MVKRVVLVLVVVTAVFLLSGCDDDPTPIGFSIEPITGRIVMFPSLCEGDRITRAGVIDTMSEDGVNFSLEDGNIIWEISAIPPQRIGRIVVGGTVPEGFQETRELEDMPQRDSFLWGYIEIVIEGKARIFRESFHINGLEQGMIMAHGDRVHPLDWSAYLEAEVC